MGGSSDPVSNVVEDVVDDPINTVTQVGTGGILSFEDGAFKLGVTGQEAIDQSLNILGPTIGELTGANAAKEANTLAKKAIEDEKARAEQERKDRQAQSARDALLASRLAGTGRGGSQTAPSGRISRFSSLGGDEADFLGL